MRHKLSLLTLVLVVLMTAPQVPASPRTDQFAPVTGIDIPVRVVIDSTFDNVTTLSNVLYSFDGYTNEIVGTADYVYQNELRIEVTTLTDAEHVSLVNYLNSINVSDQVNGNAFNATAFNSGQRNESFYGIRGHSYDASATLHWMAENLWDGRTDAYTFFVLNLTELDTDGMEHWFSISPHNMDTDQFDPGFFSSARSLTYGREVMGWGGEDDLPLQYLDLSASGWYGDFINVAWSDYGWNPTAIDRNLQDWAGLYDSAGYRQWLSDMFMPFMENLFAEESWAFYVFQNDAQIMRVVEIQNVVFINWTYDNLSDITWIIHDDRIEQLFESSFPWIDFRVSTRWKDLYSDSALVQAMKDNMVYNNDTGKYEIEVSNGFLDYVGSQVIPRYFKSDSSVIQLPSVTFLNPTNVAMTYGGVYFAGLGGMGWQLQSVSPARLLNDDGTPREGLSSVLSHEIGHSLGLPHPFYYGHWASDFTSSIMGYYPEVNTFSTFDKNKVARPLSYYYAEMLRKKLETSTTNSHYDAASFQLAAAESHALSWEFVDSIMASIGGMELLENGTTVTSTSTTNTTSTGDTSTDDTPTGTTSTTSVVDTTSNSSVADTQTSFLPVTSLGLAAPVLTAVLVQRRRRADRGT